jgi:dipeptidyl-peptidase III
LVNYKSFGFTKIIPRVSEENFAAVVAESANAANAIPLWNEASSYIGVI